MLVIRLARQGRNKYPVYRIVAAESSRPTTGKFVEILGHYNPHTKDLVIKKEETVARLQNGAQPSNSVIKLLQKENIELPGWVKLQTKNRKPKNEPEVAAEAPAVEESPAEEAAPTEQETVVAEAATDNAAEIADNATEGEVTETAEAVEEQAEKAEEASDAGAEAVGTEPEKPDTTA